MDKFQVLKEYFVLIELYSSLCSRFITSIKKSFMGPSSSLTLQIHRAFNSMCYIKLMNLCLLLKLNRKYILRKKLFTSSSQVYQCSTILCIKCVPHRNAWGEKNRNKRGGVLMELKK